MSQPRRQRGAREAEVEAMRCNVVTVDASSTPEAAEIMRSLGYLNTNDLRWRVQGVQMSELVNRYGVVPTLCRFKRSGRFLTNAYYWSKEQQLEVARASIKWLEEERARMMREVEAAEAVKVKPKQPNKANGGRAAAARMSAEQRSERAAKGAAARWNKDHIK